MRTWVACLLIAAAPVSAVAQPRGRFRDARDADTMRETAFRVLMDFTRSAPSALRLRRSGPYCLAYDLSTDPSPELLARLAGRTYVLKALSECVREDLLSKPVGILKGDENRMALGSTTWLAHDKVEIDVAAFGARCTVGLTRNGKGWSKKPGLMGCIS